MQRIASSLLCRNSGVILNRSLRSRLIYSRLSRLSTDAGDSSAPPPPKEPRRPTRWERLVDDAKDVLAVALGIERQRDIETEYDMGLREYPWVRYTDAASGKLVYRNRESGATMDEAPKDWSRRATPAHEIAVQSSASSIATIKNAPSAWERTIKALGETPIIAGLLAAGTAVREGPVGKAAAKAAQRADEIREDLQEKWETSQHPIIVNSAYVVDSLIAETEQGRALRDIKALDSGFDEFEFISDMRDNFIPRIATAFFRLDNAVLAAQCRETALAQMKAVAAARETEGLRHDGTVLSVSKVELMQAKQLEDAGGGTLPLLLVSAQVQYIHAVRNKVGELVEGSDSEIRAAIFVFALTREWIPAAGRLEWKVAEVAMHGSQLYL